MTKDKKTVGTIAAQNRKARHDFFIEETFEAGIVLAGTEVKALRAGHASIAESYAAEQGGELWLVNAHIPEYQNAGRHLTHETRRPRKLLLHRRQLEKLIGAVQRQGMTMVPLDIHFNARGMAKVTLALAKGKHNVDKRHAIKDRDWQRQKARIMRDRG
ncbi:MAG: SsrA-binding protein SmpB [Magnetospirillum sp. WYHS-4]